MEQTSITPTELAIIEKFLELLHSTVLTPTEKRVMKAITPSTHRFIKLLKEW